MINKPQKLELTWIDKDEQKGKKRADYAEETLKNLSLDLVKFTI